MCCGAPYLVSQLWMVLYDFDETLHARLYLYELEFVPIGVSLYRFYMEHDPQVRSNSKACFKVSETKHKNQTRLLRLSPGTILGAHKLLYEFPWR